MTVSRRTFVRSLGVGGAGAFLAPLITARGHEARVAQGGGPWPADLAAELRLASPAAVKLDSNENPNGPPPASLRAVEGAFRGAGRYPTPWAEALRQGLSDSLGLPLENLLVGCGSGEILRMAVYAFTTPARPLVTAAPSFEDPVHHAGTIGSAVKPIRVGADLKLDLARMAAAAGGGAGLVFLCNPNNPTGTVHPTRAVEDLVRRVLRESPSTTILIDEAYHEYVEDPGYATAIPLAMAHPRVVVSRTFSKIYGMAGLRIGYAVAHPDTLAAMNRHRLRNAVNVLGSTAALAALDQHAHLERERRLNREARDLARRGFESLGYKVAPSEANFLFVDVRRDSREFQAECRGHDVLIGRPFPPLDSHARISIGTMEEMQQAVEVFRRVLRSA